MPAMPPIASSATPVGLPFHREALHTRKPSIRANHHSNSHTTRQADTMTRLPIHTSNHRHHNPPRDTRVNSRIHRISSTRTVTHSITIICNSLATAEERHR